MKIKTITLWQPWAALVAIGRKKIETRSWATEYRGALAIHAAASMPPWVRKRLLEAGVAEETIRKLTRGAVLAVGMLADCVPITEEFVETLSDDERAFGDYRIGRYAWILEDVKRLPLPIEATGRQRLWDWDMTIEQATLLQILARARHAG